MSILPQAQAWRPGWLRQSVQRLPGSCLLCAADSMAELLCEPCQADLPGLPEHACPLCGECTTHGERCGSCLVRPPHFSGITTLFRYAFPVDRMIHALKYGHQLALAEWFGARLATRLDKLAFDRIMPMPLHPRRMSERGFNQAMEIARVLEKRLHIPVDRNSLQRCQFTPPQASLLLKQRHSNVRGAFACQNDLGGLRILLVDDVLTSGATADECARILALHGATLIHVAVVARAQKT